MSSFSMSVGSRIRGAKLSQQHHQWDDFGQPANLSGHTGGDNSNPGDLLMNQPTEETIAKIKEEAYSEGHAAGEKAGNEQGFNGAIDELKPRVELLESILQSMQDERETFYRENELSIVKLAIEIAKKIIHRELNQSPEILFYVVREALQRVSENNQITLRVNPDDLKMLENPDEFTSESLKLFKDVQFVGSSDIQRGGCIIESETGIVDAQIDMQLERIEQSLMEGLNV